MDKSRIPREITKFVPYIEDTDDYQMTTNNFQRWQWSTAESAQWHTYRQQADVLWNKYKNKKLRSTDVTDQLHQIIKNVIKYDSDKTTGHKLLDRIASAPLSINTDFETFHIKHGTPLQDNTPTQKTAATDKTISFTAKGAGGGDVKFSCKADKNNKRPGKLKGYDIEVRYKIVKPGDPLPSTVDQLEQHEIFTGAIFTLHCGASAAGSRISVSLRWFKKTDSPLNGSFSAIQTVVIA